MKKYKSGGGWPAVFYTWRKAREAGGIIGYLASSPLEAAVTAWVAVPLLSLLGLFAVLVITATPVHAVPSRLGHLYRLLTGHAGPRPGTGEDGPGPATGRAAEDGRGRGRRGQTRGGDRADRVGDEAFETPVDVVPAAADGRGGPLPGVRRPTEASGPASAAPGISRSPGVPDLTVREGAAATRGTEEKGHLEAPPTQPLPTRVEQLMLVGDITYTLPPNEVLAPAALTRRAAPPTTGWSRP